MSNELIDYATGSSARHFDVDLRALLARTQRGLDYPVALLEIYNIAKLASTPVLLLALWTASSICEHNVASVFDSIAQWRRKVFL